ncbi:MAG: hypothetical protein RL596_2206 [Bacteroidota bacterium]
MKKLVLLFSLALPALSFSQKKNRVSLEAAYGLQGNYFVGSYTEVNRPGTQAAFLNKNFIGSIGGITLKYRATKTASWGLGYSRSRNTRTVDYFTSINGFGVYIRDFDITHLNHFFEIFYQRKFSKKLPFLKYEIGLFYLRPQQQEVEVSFSGAGFEQRNFKNAKLEEGGAFVGIQFSKMIDTKFELGIKSRVYYLISTNSLETITLTPTLAYHF